MILVSDKAMQTIEYALDALDKRSEVTGADLSQTWMDVIAHNLANANTIRPPGESPFRASLVHAQEINSAQGGAG